MAKGWLVTNGFVNSDKFRELYEKLTEAAKRHGCQLIRKSNLELMERFCFYRGDAVWEDEARPDFVIFWDKDTRLARLMESAGLRLFNRAESIESCDDKGLSFIRLAGSNIRMPKTYVSPKTFSATGYPDHAFLQHVETCLSYPLVLKESFGSFGQQVHLVQDHEELLLHLASLGNRPFLLQEYIRTSEGRDIRIQMVGKEAVAAMYRYNEHDFRANISNGGQMKPYEPTREQTELARRVCQELNLDFAGVDILFGENDEPVLCEVNSNAHFKNITDCTGVYVADKILAYILDKIREEGNVK